MAPAPLVARASPSRPAFAAFSGNPIAPGGACALVFALRSVIAAISRRTSATMDCSRSRLTRCRKRSTRWFALRATRQTNANDTHVLHCCVPSCACARAACHAENSARGFRSAQWLHVQWSRILVVHVRQHRLSAFRAFHAAAPKSASDFARPHRTQGFLVSHVKHTR